MTAGDGYDDSFFHRLVPGFVLQGGGYVDNGGTIAAIPTAAPVQNEYSAAHPNVEGTVAMAKVGSDPNSATDQFFFNLGDNSANLDNQNGGFTVFGTVTAASWPVVESISGLPTVNAGSSGPFSNLPYQGTIANDTITDSNLVLVTDVTVGDTAPCFCGGTLIRTPTGDVPVERLEPGMAVLTASGRVAPVRWIGSRHIDCRRHLSPESVQPVRVARDAFGPAQPARDLLLSPDHALFTAGVLVPVKHLVNGRTIARVAATEVAYWHVELDRHDVLLAEGLPAESFLDTGNRAAFAQGRGVVQLFPQFEPRHPTRDACAPFVEDGPALVAIRARLFARAGGPQARPALALRVLAGQQLLAPIEVSRWQWRYLLPQGARLLHLLSPCWTPASLDPAQLDRRRLGIRLHGVSVDGRALDLTAATLFGGFYPCEQTAEGVCRWTDGNARILAPIGAAEITLHVGDETAAAQTIAA